MTKTEVTEALCELLAAFKSESGLDNEEIYGANFRIFSGRRPEVSVHLDRLPSEIWNATAIRYEGGSQLIGPRGERYTPTYETTTISFFTGEIIATAEVKS